MAEPVDLDARLDAVFAASPKEFTAARDALVRDLKAEGRPEDAADVKVLRKPTVAVAAINRATRERPDAVADLVELSDELDALQHARDADRDALRDLTRRRRSALVALTELAAASIERPESARPAITATLDAVSLDGPLRDDLLRGRLTAEQAPPARFGFGFGSEDDDDAPAARAVPRRAPARTSRTSRTAPPPRDELALRRARAELDAVRARAESADEALREQTDAAADAVEHLDAAQRHVVDLEVALADARTTLADAKRDARDAERGAKRARAEQERIAAALHTAERAAAAAAGDADD